MNLFLKYQAKLKARQVSTIGDGKEITGSGTNADSADTSLNTNFKDMYVYNIISASDNNTKATQIDDKKDILNIQQNHPQNPQNSITERMPIQSVTWSQEHQALIDWFITQEVPTEPFHLEPHLYVADPGKFFASLRREIKIGPSGPRARMGTLQSDLQKLKLYKLQSKRAPPPNPRGVESEEGRCNGYIFFDKNNAETCEELFFNADTRWPLYTQLRPKYLIGQNVPALKSGDDKWIQING